MVVELLYTWHTSYAVYGSHYFVPLAVMVVVILGANPSISNSKDRIQRLPWCLVSASAHSGDRDSCSAKKEAHIENKSRKCLSLTVRPATTGPQPIKVKFPDVGRSSTFRYYYWLTQQLTNTRFSRSVYQRYWCIQQPLDRFSRSIYQWCIQQPLDREGGADYWKYNDIK